MDTMQLTSAHQKELAAHIRDFADKIDNGEVCVLQLAFSISAPFSLNGAGAGCRNEISLLYTRTR